MAASRGQEPWGKVFAESLIYTNNLTSFNFQSQHHSGSPLLHNPMNKTVRAPGVGPDHKALGWPCSSQELLGCLVSPTGR